MDSRRKGRVHGEKKSWIEGGKVGFMERKKLDGGRKSRVHGEKNVGIELLLIS